MNLSDYLEAEHDRYTRLNPGAYVRFARHITCADGFHVSAQASEYHYCQPRENVGPWKSVELGYPSEAVAEFIPFAEDPCAPTDTVYACVPVAIVEAVIEAHGGMTVTT